MSILAYAVNEALISLRRSRRTAAMSVGTIAIAFLTLGGFMLLAGNLQAIVDRWASAAEMSVYLRDDIDDEAREALVADLRAHPAVAGVEFLSQAEALERFRQEFPELSEAAESAGNPFPPSIEVRLHTDPVSAGAADAMAGQLAERAGVVDVQYERRWIARLVAIIASIRLAGVIIAAVLVLGAAFTVAAVVRLSLHARREEVEIMQLVGAPFSFLRGPSVAEGTILGGIGATLSLLILWGMYVAARPYLTEAVTAWGSGAQLRFLAMPDAALLIVSGLVVGGVSGWIASRAVR